MSSIPVSQPATRYSGPIKLNNKPANNATSFQYRIFAFFRRPLIHQATHLIRAKRSDELSTAKYELDSEAGRRYMEALERLCCDRNPIPLIGHCFLGPGRRAQAVPQRAHLPPAFRRLGNHQLFWTRWRACGAIICHEPTRPYPTCIVLCMVCLWRKKSVSYLCSCAPNLILSNSP